MELFINDGTSFEKLIGTKKNYVFIGEAGSGKSEIVLNTALMLAKTGKKVELYDLDQTKPLYRSRDLQGSFREKGVEIMFQDQYLDAPTSVGGVLNSLQGDGYTLLDIGGGHSAARMAGPYSDLLNSDDTLPVYIVNPYRPWTKDIGSVDETMSHILRSMRLNRIYVLGNPNLGCETTAEEVVEGIEKIEELFSGITEVNSMCVRSEIAEEVRSMTDRNVIPIDLYLTYQWIDKEN